MPHHRPIRTRTATRPATRGTVDDARPDPTDTVPDDDTDSCDGYVVLVADPQTTAADTYGPYPGTVAVAEADRRRRELDAEELDDVTVLVVRHHAPCRRTSRVRRPPR